jgi:hypothetical protein
MIRTIRGVRVMLDRDLAKIYGVPTFRFNEAIKRNRHRFPTDFMFQLTPAEFDRLKSQSGYSSQIAMSSGKHATLTSQIAISTKNGIASKHRHLIDTDSAKFPREAYRAIAPLSVRLGASANFSPFFRSLITNVLFSPWVDQGPRGTSLKSTNFQSVTSVSFNPR